MLLGSSPETPYDLRFRLFSVPVRVHPIFWLVMVLLSGQPESLLNAAIFVVCAFVSILVHEFGHGLVGRLLGYPPEGIVLYAMGGYCEFQTSHQVPWRRLLILMAGPGAGFGLLLFVLFFTTGAIIPVERMSESPIYHEAIGDLIFINLIWGILNLLPIWPLDGGQITGVLLGMIKPEQGQRWSHIVSLLVAGAIGLFVISRDQTSNGLMMGLWFGYFAFVNYQILQSYHDAYSSSQYD